MQIIDAQLHEFGPQLTWEGVDDRTRHGLLTELIFGWMDAVGVDKAIIIPLDAAWGESAVTRHHDRLAGVFSIREPGAPNAAELVARLSSIPGAVGLRMAMGRIPTDPTGEIREAEFKAGVFAPLLAACEKSGLPLFCAAFGYAYLIGEIAKAHPTLRVVADHMAMAQPPLNPRDTPPWKQLPPLLELAKYPNVFVKLCGSAVLSEQPFPFSDVWPHIHQILDAFGAERVMWASDIGRFAGRIGWQNHYPEARAEYPGKHTYAESLFMIRETRELSEVQKALILGGTVRRLTGWPKSDDAGKRERG